MLSNTQLYYLQTMGIEPWVMRNSESQALVTVVLDTKISDVNQKKLFYAMFRSIGLSEDMLDVVHDLNADGIKQYINKTKPQVIIALGCRVDVCDKTPVVVMHHPSDLLQNPNNKKKAYYDLGQVASCLMLDSNNSTQA
jgi:hypothetical protein